MLSRTRFGAHVYATGGNEEAAILTGIPTKRVKVICFMMTGALCGIAAALLLGQMRSASPLTGAGFELDIIAAVVIGGTPLFGGAGSILGTLLGAAILGMITNGLVLLGASAYLRAGGQGPYHHLRHSGGHAPPQKVDLTADGPASDALIW